MPFSIRSLTARRKDSSSPVTERPGSSRHASVSGTPLTSEASNASHLLPPRSRSDTLQTQSTGTRARTRSADKRGEPTGLHVLYRPDKNHSVDIIFVHGLAGSSQSSWAWKRDLDNFWPKEWLPAEPEVKDARILTFGYNAFFMTSDQDIFNISAFAKQLLLQLKFATSNSDSLNLGKVPIIFVVHSMGGLVVKKALILGFSDPEYSDIINSVRSIIFLATPHRGSGLAQILNKFLLVSFQSPKKYVGDLQRNSSGIDDINDQFRHHASRLQIFSFFETLPSYVGPKKMMVVERDSAILGYFNEISAPLNANHAHVSKFHSPDDQNYVDVKNVIRSMVEKVRKKVTNTPQRRSPSLKSQSSLQSTLQTLFNMIEPRSELESLLDLYVEGSGDWILSDPNMKQWLHDDREGPAVLHVTGNPGSGKSVMASFIVNRLEQMDKVVQNFFFRFDSEQNSKSLRHCLLSLAYQLSLSHPAYGRRLKTAFQDRQSLSGADVRRLWQKAFVGILSKLDGLEPIYWIIDAIDESDSVHLFMNLLSGLHSSSLPLRVLFLTRPHTVSRHFAKLKSTLRPGAFSSVTMSTPQRGLSLYISQELEFTRWPEEPEFIQVITHSLLEKCHGNFLWLRLVLKELAKCDFQHEAILALEETPPELAAVYRRIESQIIKDMRPDSQRLAIHILSWIACSNRPLVLGEVAEALKTPGRDDAMLDPRQTIHRLCGDFVMVEKNSCISMIHHTAKEFLTQTTDSVLHIDTSKAHTLLARRCLTELTDSKFRFKIKTEGCIRFSQYATTSWAHHLALSDTGDEEISALLTHFLSSISILSWIDAACQLGQLRTLTSTASNLNLFRDRRRSLTISPIPITPYDQTTEVIGNWSSDLIRIVGKFGNHLVQNPAVIYCLVPAFCPPDSAIGSRFFPSPTSQLAISGIVGRSWEDSLASFSVGFDCQPAAISSFEGHFAMQISDDTVAIYSSAIFQNLRVLCHGEVIVTHAFNQDGSRLATCGSRMVKIWDVISAQPLERFKNPMNTRAVAISFNAASNRVWLCCEDGTIRSREIGSQDYDTVITREISTDGSLGGASGTPYAVAFSSDGTKLAIAFRGRTLGLWNPETGRLINRCLRRNENALSTSANHLRAFPNRLTWNPVHEHVLGIYNDGNLFKWNPVDFYAEELDNPIQAHEVACSPDGRFIVAASNTGSLYVWQYDSMRLIYHLSCTTPVTSLAFSADAKRIYDLRDSFCNVWEPNALVRLADIEEKASETSSQHTEFAQTSLISESGAVIPDPVTTLAIGNITPTYCFANDNGDLTLYQRSSSDPTVMSGGFVGATCLALSYDDELLASAELHGTVIVRAISSIEPSEQLRIKSAGLVQQLLFLKHKNSLLVSTPDELSLWDTSAKSRTATCPLEVMACRVLRHPLTKDFLLVVSSDGVRVLSSDQLSEQGARSFSFKGISTDFANAAPNSSKRAFARHNLGQSDTQSVIGRVLSQEGEATILIQILRPSVEGGGSDITLALLDTSYLGSAPMSTTTGTIDCEPLPSSLLDRIEVPLGFVGGLSASGRQGASRRCLVFLDIDFWVCTWELGDMGANSMRRHFFLPNDWINLDDLDMAAVSRDGTLYFPRSGQVALISGGFESGWSE